MRDVRAEAIAHLEDEYNAGEYAGQVLDFLLKYRIFDEMPSGYYYDSEHFDINQKVIDNIINMIEQEETNYV